LARRIVSIEMGEEGGEESVSESVKRRLEAESVGQKRKAKNTSGQSGGRKEDNRKKRSKVKLSNASLKITSAVDDPTDSVDDDLMLAIELSRKEAAVSASNPAMARGVAEALGVDFNLGDSFSMEQTLSEEDFAVPGPSMSHPVAQPSTSSSTSSTTSSTLLFPLGLG
jgi:hypothetical protein